MFGPGTRVILIPYLLMITSTISISETTDSNHVIQITVGDISDLNSTTEEFIDKDMVTTEIITTQLTNTHRENSDPELEYFQTTTEELSAIPSNETDGEIDVLQGTTEGLAAVPATDNETEGFDSANKKVLLPQLRILVGTPLIAVLQNQTRAAGPTGKSKLIDGHFHGTTNRIVTCYASNRRPFEGFACDEENCVPLKWVCDGDRDCDSGADEANCRMSYCLNGQFRCIARGKPVCLTADHLCDGHIDCHDGLDEDPKSCRLPGSMTNYCREGYFRCKNGRGCVPSDQVCDWMDDCDDGSDERQCQRPPQDLCYSEHHFLCYKSLPKEENPKCIPRSWLCDRHLDCPGGEDEIVENCRRGSSNSAQRTFRAFFLFPSLGTTSSVTNPLWPFASPEYK